MCKQVCMCVNAHVDAPACVCVCVCTHVREGISGYASSGTDTRERTESEG